MYTVNAGGICWAHPSLFLPHQRGQHVAGGVLGGGGLRMGGIWLGESRSVGRGGGESSRRGRNCGELRSLAWLEQSLLCGAKTGPKSREPRNGWLMSSRPGGRLQSLGCSFVWLSLDGVTSGMGTGLRCFLPLSGKRGSQQSPALSQASPSLTVHKVGTVKLLHPHGFTRRYFRVIFLKACLNAWIQHH